MKIQYKIIAGEKPKFKFFADVLIACASDEASSKEIDKPQDLFDGFKLKLKDREDELRKKMPEGCFTGTAELMQYFGINVAAPPIPELIVKWINENSDKLADYTLNLLPDYSVCDWQRIMNKGEHKSTHRDGKFHVEIGKGWFEKEAWATTRPKIGCSFINRVKSPRIESGRYIRN